MKFDPDALLSEIKIPSTNAPPWSTNVPPSSLVFVADLRAFVVDLRTAACAFAARSDSFAEGKARTCNDIADKLQRYGSFASEKQKDYAGKLIEWSKPREGWSSPRTTVPRTTIKPAPTPEPVVSIKPTFPRIVSLSAKFRVMRVGDYKFKRSRGGQIWTLYRDKLVARIEGDALRVLDFKARLAGVSPSAILNALLAIETDPEAALAREGQATGTCGCCGRTLTDPVSVARGIGPICIAGF